MQTRNVNVWRFAFDQSEFFMDLNKNVIRIKISVTENYISNSIVQIHIDEINRMRYFQS